MLKNAMPARRPPSRGVGKHRTMEHHDTTGEGYIRFKARQHDGGDHIAPHPRDTRAFPHQPLDSVARSIYDVGSDKFTRWEDFCSWCLTAARADHSLVAVPSDEVIASIGCLSPEKKETLAQWLRDQFQPGPFIGLGEGALRSIAAEVDARWVTGIHVPSRRPGAEGGVLVGLLCERPLFHDARQAVITQATYTLRLVD